MAYQTALTIESVIKDIDSKKYFVAIHSKRICLEYRADRKVI